MYLVTVIIPCFNEKLFIEQALASALSTQNNSFEVEVLVVDGLSTDGTREIVAKMVTKDSRIRLIDNPNRVVPYAMNIGIKTASGDLIVRLDAHAIYPKGYIDELVKSSLRYKVDNIGGVWDVHAPTNDLQAKVNAIVSVHRLGIGNAAYRTGVDRPTEVDTVPFGCFPRSLFDRIGLFDTDMVRNQDDELNARILRAGGKILLLPNLVIKYYCRANLVDFLRMFFQYAQFKPLGNIKVGKVSTLRQLAPPIFVLGLTIVWSLFFFGLLDLILPAILTLSYLGIISVVATRVALQNRLGIKGLLLLSLTFTAVHFSYGIGYFKGIYDFIICKKHKLGTINIASSR